MVFFSEDYKKENILSKIDARIKIAVGAVILAMALSQKGFILPLAILFLCVLFFIHARISPKILAIRFLEPLFIVFAVVILKYWTSGSSGFWDGISIAVRIFSAVSVVFVVWFSTPFSEITASLSYFKIPSEFIEILIFAGRYSFVLFEDAYVIYNAQKNRLGYSNIKKGLNSFGKLSGALILKAFENSQNLSQSMIQRGYDGTLPIIHHKPLKPLQILGSVFFVLIVVIMSKIF